MSSHSSPPPKGRKRLLILSSPFVSANTKLLADQALLHRFPAITLFPHFARDGGLIGYGPNFLSYYRYAGVMAARILRGARPCLNSNRPPAKFEFVLNLKTAKALGITLPPATLLGRADKVIE